MFFPNQIEDGYEEVRGLGGQEGSPGVAVGRVIQGSSGAVVKVKSPRTGAGYLVSEVS